VVRHNLLAQLVFQDVDALPQLRKVV